MLAILDFFASVIIGILFFVVAVLGFLFLVALGIISFAIRWAMILAGVVGAVLVLCYGWTAIIG